jgi:hypothetical protein
MLLVGEKERRRSGGRGRAVEREEDEKGFSKKCVERRQKKMGKTKKTRVCPHPASLIPLDLLTCANAGIAENGGKCCWHRRGDAERARM